MNNDNNEVMLKVENITKRFPGTLALNEVSFEVKRGEVHAVVGENGAGKSTLMNIISGLLEPDEGRIVFMGGEVRFLNPREAQDAGIGFVHQELSLCPHLKVSENIFMGRLPHLKNTFVNRKRLKEMTDYFLEKFQADFAADDVVKNLTVAQQQIIEIAKALALDCKLLILDEPTSSITENETKVLFGIINEIKRQGMSILYISHRMEEIFQVCDSVTVIRDGCLINTLRTAGVTSDQVVRMMVGRNIENMYPPKSSGISDVILKVEGLKSKDVFKDISFSLRKGEILGFYGLVGAGRTEVMRALCGIDPCDNKVIEFRGDRVENNAYRRSIDRGIVYITEDRKSQGLFLKMSVENNISAAMIENIRTDFRIDRDKESALCGRYVGELGIKIASEKQKVDSLSGGNQQKVMIGKWLATYPKVLIMDEPTRGIDVGSKSEIHKMLRKLSEEGVGVIVISSELPEIIGLADRVIVMHEGTITGELSGDDIKEENIIIYASNFKTSSRAANE
ncbi:MAG: sugar ABC transporter ATP-binding protein [Synergistaceae bacterium]|jgi:ribose transport system ATP-binding protein|nr:sugar ABC transporter ATP-binding protein [Synergistaceae bacterium]